MAESPRPSSAPLDRYYVSGGGCLVSVNDSISVTHSGGVYLAEKVDAEVTALRAENLELRTQKVAAEHARDDAQRELLQILQRDQSDADCVTAIEDWFGALRAVSAEGAAERK